MLNMIVTEPLMLNRLPMPGMSSPSDLPTVSRPATPACSPSTPVRTMIRPVAWP